jgi:hypothetical protein
MCDTLLGGQDRLSASVKPLCCFVTPEVEAQRSKRQYLTHFFVALLPVPDQRPWTTVDVDGSETSQALWLTPKDALARARAGDIVIFPPQLYILERLGSIQHADEPVAAAAAFFGGGSLAPASAPASAAGCAELSLVMQPEIAPDRSLVLPFDEAHRGHPGAPGERHRVVGWDFKAKNGSNMRLEMSPSVETRLRGGRWRCAMKE